MAGVHLNLAPNPNLRPMIMIKGKIKIQNRAA